MTLILALAFLTAAIYVAGWIYFKDRFLPGTSLNGYDISFRTAREVENLLGREVSAYVLEVDTMNHGVESISAEEVGLRYVPDGSVRELLREQDRRKWYLALMQTRRLSTGKEIALDDELLEKAVDGLRCMDPSTVTEPSNAVLKETEEGFVIMPEVEGTSLDKNKVLALIRDAMLSREIKVNLESGGCYKRPAIYRDSEALMDNCAMMNRIRNVVITYDFAYATETVDRSVFEDWMITDADGLYGFNKKKVTAFVEALAEKYDTVGKARSFRTYDGRYITTSGGNYGWTIGVPEETSALIQDIEEGISKVKEPVYTSTATSRDVNDIGNTYIEVDLHNQRMVYYRDGNVLADTPVVTGTYYINDYHTPVGCFKVLEEQTDTVIFENGGYEQVSWYLPFYREEAPENPEGSAEEEILQGEPIREDPEGDLLQDGSGVTYALQEDGSASLYGELQDGQGIGKPGSQSIWSESVQDAFSSSMREYALHDAAWRQDYAGDAYMLNGTNGSVDVPPSWMERLCEFVTVGTAVIVYE